MTTTETTETTTTEETEMTETETTERYAVVTSDASAARVAQYLPRNYSTRDTSDNRVLIMGHDVAGWTLDEYVLPRLASGLIMATEVTEDEEPCEINSDGLTGCNGWRTSYHHLACPGDQCARCGRLDILCECYR